MTDAVYENDLTFLINAPAQTECFLRGLEQVARRISLYVDENKTEYM